MAHSGDTHLFCGRPLPTAGPPARARWETRVCPGAHAPPAPAGGRGAPGVPAGGPPPTPAFLAVLPSGPDLGLLTTCRVSRTLTTQIPSGGPHVPTGPQSRLLPLALLPGIFARSQVEVPISHQCLRVPRGRPAAVSPEDLLPGLSLQQGLCEAPHPSREEVLTLSVKRTSKENISAACSGQSLLLRLPV